MRPAPLPGHVLPRAHSGRSAPSAPPMEVFAWMGRHPGHPLSRALARPATSSSRGSRRRTRRPRSWRSPRPHSPPVSRPKRPHELAVARTRRETRPERVRPPGREDARGVLHRRVLQPHAIDVARRRTPSPGRDAGVPAPNRDARRHGRGDRHPQAVLPRLGGPRRLRTPRRRHDRALGDGDDDRGRLHPLRPPGDRLPRGACPSHADLDQHGAGASRGKRQADHLHARASRPPPGADR